MTSRQRVMTSVAQGYAERDADALLVAWGRTMPGRAFARNLTVQELADLRADLERAGLEAVLESAETDGVARRATITAGCRKRLMQIASQLERDQIRARSMATPSGVDRQEILVAALKLVPSRARRVFSGWDGIDRVDVEMDAVTVAVDRVERLFDPARGSLWAYVSVCLDSALMDRHRALSEERSLTTTVPVGDISDVLAPEQGESDVEAALNRVDAELRCASIDAWAEGHLPEEQRRAWFARRAGGGPGDDAERQAFHTALSRVRSRFEIFGPV